MNDSFQDHLQSAAGLSLHQGLSFLKPQGPCTQAGASPPSLRSTTVPLFHFNGQRKGRTHRADWRTRARGAPLSGCFLLMPKLSFLSLLFASLCPCCLLYSCTLCAVIDNHTWASVETPTGVCHTRAWKTVSRDRFLSLWKKSPILQIWLPKRPIFPLGHMYIYAHIDMNIHITLLCIQQ